MTAEQENLLELKERERQGDIPTGDIPPLVHRHPVPLDRSLPRIGRVALCGHVKTTPYSGPAPVHARLCQVCEGIARREGRGLRRS